MGSPKKKAKKKTRRGDPTRRTASGQPKRASRTKKIAKATRDELVVFAIRLPKVDRDIIHVAAGPQKASEFAREVLVAAATNDLPAMKKILKRAFA